jgi:conjugative relaxase-like TrwC/TraI family protein
MGRRAPLLLIMFTISTAAKGRSAGRYYLSLAREDYYLKGGEPPGEWLGSAARLLGLEGEVRPEDMTRLMEGIAPDGRSLVQNAGDPRRRSLWDGTFSAPKSVSVAWGSGDDALRQGIEAAHDESVRAAATAMEEIIGRTRRGHNGTTLESGGIAVATFKHGSSRAGDANLHTHCAIFNIASRADGTFGALSSEELFRNKMALGALYRAELAQRLSQRLGLRLVAERTWFELVGVPASLITAHSQRRAEIQAALKEYGEDNAIAAKEAALRTRRAKDLVPRAELSRRWRELAAEHGFIPDRDLVRGPVPGRLNPARAVAEITEGQSYLGERELVRRVAEQVQTGGADIAAIRAAARAEVGRLIHIGEVRRERQYTTPAMLQQEERMIVQALQGRNSTRHAVPRWLANFYVRAAGLSAEQATAVKQLTTGRGTVQVVQGFAGTGKSQMLRTAGKIWLRDGKSVVGLALQGKAAAGLEKSSGIRSMTLESFLMAFRPRSLGQVFKDMKHDNEPLRIPGCYREGQYRTRFKQRLNIHRNSILVVDEAGMLGTGGMKELLDLAHSVRAKVVLVGDERQLPAIAAGGPFAALGRELGQTMLTEIQRQNEPWARAMVRDFADGSVGKGLEAMQAHGLVNIQPTVADARAALIKDWKQDAGKEPLILAATRAEVADLNKRAQAERQLEGRVEGPALRVRGESFHRGDRVLFGQNSAALGVSNGQLGTVVGVKTGLFAGLRVKLDHDRRVIQVNPGTYDRISLGYALTTHKAQGVTVDHAYVMGSDTMQAREMTYVQVSRSRAETRLYLTEAQAGPGLSTVARQMGRSTAKELARDLHRDPARGTAPQPVRPPSPSPTKTQTQSHTR